MAVRAIVAATTYLALQVSKWSRFRSGPQEWHGYRGRRQKRKANAMPGNLPLGRSDNRQRRLTITRRPHYDTVKPSAETPLWFRRLGILTAIKGGLERASMFDVCIRGGGGAGYQLCHPPRKVASDAQQRAAWPGTAAVWLVPNDAK